VSISILNIITYMLVLSFLLFCRILKMSIIRIYYSAAIAVFCSKS